MDYDDTAVPRTPDSKILRESAGAAAVRRNADGGDDDDDDDDRPIRVLVVAMNIQAVCIGILGSANCSLLMLGVAGLRYKPLQL